MLISRIRGSRMDFAGGAARALCVALPLLFLAHRLLSSWPQPGARRFPRLQRDAEPGRRRHRLPRQGRLGHRRLVAHRRVDLQDADRGAAVIALLLSLCRRRRARRALGRPDQHVRGRKRVQDRRRQRLLRARIPARRLPGIRYGRAGELDGPADRRARNRTAPPPSTGQTPQ